MSEAVQKPLADTITLSSMDDILADVKAGKPVILVDDEDRENEGDLIIAAEMASADNINFMAKEGRGLICLPMEGAMVERLGLELMGRGDNTHHRTAFTVSIEAKEGVTTGISAADRATTILKAIAPQSGPSDIATPGHVFPLKARDGGVLVRAGHTEAAVDLAKLSGFSGAGVICEIMNDDGTMARLPDLMIYAQKHGLKIGTIADLIAYRRQTESLVERVHESKYSTDTYGDFDLILYANTLQYTEHVVLVKGDISDAEPTMVRMHGVDFMRDILGQGDQILQKSMAKIQEKGSGVIVIIRESNPRALSRKLGKAERVNDDQTPKEQEFRSYGIGAQILKDLGVSEMILLSSSSKNIVGLDGYGLKILKQESIF